MTTFGSRESFSLVASAGGFQSETSPLGQPRKIGGEECVVEVDRCTWPPAAGRHAASAFAVSGKRRAVETFELLELLGGRRPSAVERVNVCHGHPVRRRFDLVQNPSDESIQRVLGDVEALGDLTGRKPSATRASMRCSDSVSVGISARADGSERMSNTAGFKATPPSPHPHLLALHLRTPWSDVAHPFAASARAGSARWS